MLGFFDIDKCLKIGEILLRDLARGYQITIDVPTIIYLETPEIIACATVDHTIQVSEGFFRYCLENVAPMFRNQPYHSPEYSLENFTTTLVMWVLAHEFFHIIRGHFRVLLIHPNCHQAIEYDADCCATAAIYRFHCSLALRADPPNEDRTAIKQSLILTIFFPIRQFIASGISTSKTHPSWQIRLWSIYTKLAHIDNFDPRTGKYSGQFAAEITALQEILFGMEKAYNGDTSPTPTETFSHFVQYDRESQVNELLSHWEKVEPTVSRCQYSKLFTEGDRELERFTADRSLNESPQ